MDMVSGKNLSFKVVWKSGIHLVVKRRFASWEDHMSLPR